MPTMKDNLYFHYDGKSCKDFGLMNINLDGGMFEETLVANRTIVETEVKGSDTPLFHRIEEEALEFDMAIAFTGSFTDEDIDNVILWLFQENYKPLYFENKPNRVFYCMPVGSSSIVHNGLKEGYVTITMRCKSSKIESQTQITDTYDVTATTVHIEIMNNGHVEVFPEISIEKIGNGHITIMKNDKIFEIRDLSDQEGVYIDTGREIIESDFIGVHRYENVIGEYHDMSLTIGNNDFAVVGSCKIAFRYRLKYRF